MDVLECLKQYGQRLDLEIAEETGIPLATVQIRLDELAHKGEIIKCAITRFDGGKPIRALQCRVSCYMPRKTAGRKPTPA